MVEQFGEGGMEKIAEKNEIARDVAKIEREEGNVLTIDGIEIGVRYFSEKGPDFILGFQKTEALKISGLKSRSKKGHGYVLPIVNPEKEMVIGYEVPLTDWERKNRKYGENELPDDETIFLDEDKPYKVKLSEETLNFLKGE